MAGGVLKVIAAAIFVILSIAESALSNQSGGFALSGRVPAPTYGLFSDNGTYRLVRGHPAYRIYVAHWRAMRMPASQSWSEALVLPRKEFKLLTVKKHLTTSSYIRIVAP